MDKSACKASNKIVINRSFVCHIKRQQKESIGICIRKQRYAPCWLVHGKERAFATLVLITQYTITLTNWHVNLTKRRYQVQIPARQYSGNISDEDEWKSPLYNGVPIEESQD